MVKLQNLIIENQCLPFRSRRSQMFFKVGVLKCYTIFTGKHLRWSLFLIKFQSFQSFRSATLLKSNSNKGVFLWRYLRTVFFIEHFQWLLLPFNTTFRNYYWEDLVVVLFTLTHPSKRFNTCFKTETYHTEKHLKKVLDMLQVLNKF